MEWSIQDVARSARTTSRALRHYDDIGLLKPSRIGGNGYRYYDDDALVRLQRILLLRELGLGLPAIAEVLQGERDAALALLSHLRLLEQEQERIGRQIASVRTTLRKLEGGEPLMAEEVFDGFDHTQCKEEVVELWGGAAYESGDRWWRALSTAQREEFTRAQLDIGMAFGTAHAAGRSPDSDEVQAITQRQYDWITIGWTGGRPTAEQFTGLGQLYVDDPRFTANHDTHGEGTAVFIRDAMKTFAERNL